MLLLAMPGASEWLLIILAIFMFYLIFKGVKSGMPSKSSENTSSSNTSTLDEKESKKSNSNKPPMQKLIKIIIIAAGLIVSVIIMGLIKMTNDPNSKGVGIIGIIITFCFLAGAKAIWKFDPSDEIKEEDGHTLDKN